MHARTATPRFSRSEAAALALLLAIFTFFTWRAVEMFYTGDDMMNMYNAWSLDPWRLALAQLLVWEPVYRPAGAAIYRLFYAVFGFHPQPLYIFCWCLLCLNVVLAYFFLRKAASTTAAALTALSLVLVHGSFEDLYFSAGTIYDRLWFLFTVAGLIAYLHFRRQGGWRWFAATALFAMLAMDSKESGVVILPLMVACEACFFAPEWRGKPARDHLRRLGPLFAALLLLSPAFVFGRVNRTPGLTMNAAYVPRFSAAIWLDHIADYLGILTYHHVAFTLVSASVLLAAMGAVALAARSRPMIFGWLFFLISITPVAFLAARHGYVLYLPSLGLGLFFASAIDRLTAPLGRVLPHTGAVVFLLVTIGGVLFHLRNWPPAWDPHGSPEYHLSRQFLEDYPHLPANSRLLFVTDEFPPASFDLLFNLRLLYHDRSIVADRLQGSPDQRPNPNLPLAYDHMLVAEGGHYAELDPANPAESIRLHILRGASISDEMDIRHPDHPAYVVYGLVEEASGEPSRWTKPRAKLKFRLRTPPAWFTARFWLPDFVVAPTDRQLSVVVNGQEIGTAALNRQGANEVRFRVPPNLTSDSGYTFVEINVSNPYQDANGNEYGVLLMRAGFEP